MFFHLSCIQCRFAKPPPPLLALHGDLEDARKAREDADRISLRSAEVWASVGECSMTKRDTIGTFPETGRMTGSFPENPRNIHEEIMMICHDLLLVSIVYYLYLLGLCHSMKPDSTRIFEGLNWKQSSSWRWPHAKPR